MIGVICRVEQRLVVEEFFELFKTPWEHYQQGRSYDAIIATTGEVPDVHDAKLLVLFGAERQAADARYGIAPLAKRRGGWLKSDTGLLPVYGDLLVFAEHCSGTPCLSSDAGSCGVRMQSNGTLVLRLGYDLFDETRELLSNGQPAEQANIPALDLHIELVRTWILSAGVDLVEIPPIPAGHPFVVCLTHDIDFIGIR